MELNCGKKEKIRTSIKWFAVFMSLMLFQTSYMRFGTITAFVSLFLVIITAWISGNISFSYFRLPINSAILIAFLVCTFTVTLFYGGLPGNFSRYAAQIILCVVLIAMPSINYKETDFLETVFILASVFYAILIIISCYRLAGQRYYHGSIVLFNTQLDPNFVGIPLVAASVLVFNKLLCKSKRILNIFFYITLVIAIVYTASRGNMLSFIISNALLIFIYMTKNNVAIHIKIAWIIITVVAFFYLSNYLSILLPEQWGRMSTFNERSDNGRFELWKRAIEEWKMHPVLGSGFGSMYRIYGKATHNTYFQLLSETGTLGMALFLTFIAGIIKKAFKFDKIYFCLLLGCLFQIAFLDALDNRCLWVILCWMALLPKNREAWKYVHKENIVQYDTKP